MLLHQLCNILSARFHLFLKNTNTPVSLFILLNALSVHFLNAIEFLIRVTERSVHEVELISLVLSICVVRLHKLRVGLEELNS